MYTGKLVRLREYREEDLPLINKYINDEDIRKNLVACVPSLITMQIHKDWFKNLKIDDKHCNFAIETIDGNKFIGDCGADDVDWKNSVATVGIYIGDKDYQSKGYGTDAMKVLIKFIFDEMNIRKIKLDVFSFNERAIKCYEKLGFKREAVLRNQLFRFGKYHDVYIMGLFKEEFIDN